MKPHPARRHSKAHSTRTKEVHWVENASLLSTAKTRRGLVAMILELETGLGAKISHDEEAISDFRSGAFASIHSVPGTCTATVCPALGAVPHKQCPMHAYI